MSVTLSPPVRVFAVIGALVATGLAAYVFLLGGSPSTAETSTPLLPTAKSEQQTHAKPRAQAHKPAARASRQTPAVDFPWQVQRALGNRKVVVIAVYVPGASVDAIVRSEARAGARMSKAAFVHISAANEPALQKLVAKTGVLPAPAVVIVKRPGVVTSTLSVIDRQTVAAAVPQAKSGR